jgi:acyl carrier protein
MKRSGFYNLLKEILELDDCNLDEKMNLKELKEYDSLAILSMIAMIDEKFNKQLSAKDFTEIITVENLIEKIGTEKFD